MNNPLIELSQSLAEIVEHAAPHVVAVSGQGKNVQSGVLIDATRILTVDHDIKLGGEL